MTAQKHALPDEDPQERAQRATAIANELNPQSELQHHLVECINNAIDRQNRCTRAVRGKLEKQYRSIRRKQKRKVARQVEEGIRLFEKGCPVQAILVLRRSAEGCRWLLAHWVALRERLARFGLMTEVDLNALLKLLGQFAVSRDTASFSVTSQVAELHYLALGTWPTKAAFGPYTLRETPAALLQQYQALWPTPQAHRDELLRRIDAGIAELDARIAELDTDEAAEREDETLDAMMISDAKEADLCLRYTKEADTALEKALNTFWALQERDAAGGAPTADAESAEDAAASVAEAESPPPEVQAVPAAPSALPEDLAQEVAATGESLVAMTAGLAPEAAWDSVPQSLATLPPDELHEAARVAAQARSQKEPGPRLDVSSKSDMQQEGYVASPGNHSAVLAGLREMQRRMAAMGSAESPADPPVAALSRARFRPLAA
jgi:hypothetical protein